MASDGILSRIEQFAHTFAAERLTPYTARLKKGAIGTSPKEVNDALWGTIKLSPLEVVVIDSPLVQRLRLIRQLGVVHWVYPGATHTRFEHTLGVLHQTQQLVTAINQASNTPGSVPINTNKAALVRFCAVLHDIGHGVFSHVSEHALARRTDLRIALQDFARAKRLPKVQLSEVVAYHLIGSPAFLAMLAEALDQLSHPINFGGGSSTNASQVIDLAQKAIVGHHIDEEVPLLHEIITGPFDADKLDYYARDARHAGIPSLLDISRLLQKITSRRVLSRDLPDDIMSAISNRYDAHDLFGLKWSGAAILDELHLARVLLYAKIYRHKKVLAIEAMIDALFEALGSEPGIDLMRLISLCYEFCDDQMLVSGPEALLKAAGADTCSPNLRTFVEDVLVRLRDRDLYVSALAIMPKYPTDPWEDDKRQTRGLRDLAMDCGNSQAIAALRREIAVELRSLVEVFPEAIGDTDPTILGYSVVISAKPPLGSGTEIDRALVLQGDRFVRGREMHRINQPAWADAYNFANPQAILFAPRDCAAAVYVAAERLINRKYSVALPPSSVEISKLDSVTVIDLKRRLEELGWYHGVSLDVRPPPERLSRQDVAVRLGRLAPKFATIDEFKANAGPRRAPEMEQRLRNWLAQFRDDDLIGCAISMLERVLILGRDDSYAALGEFLELYPSFRGAIICPLGDLKDSGSVQAYLSRDLELAFPHTMSVEKATERRGDEPIVFLDDFTGSGSQVLDILGKWFDEDTLKQDQLEEVRLPFGDDERTFLRSRPVAFVFLAAWSDGLKRIEDAARELGLNATVYARLKDDDLPFAFDGKSPEEPELLARFRQRCFEIGKSLLASEGKSAEKQNERALGYGNRAMLLATRLNVPTQTLTCFWNDGTHDAVEWHALIRRRSKT